MSVNQYYGAGTLLKYGGLTSASVGSYVTIGGIKGDIKGASTVQVVDISTHDTMVVDRTKRKGGATIDEGKYTFELFSDLGDSTGQMTLMNNRGKTAYFQMTPAAYSPAKTITFTAVISSVSDTYPMENYQTWSVELDVSGPKVFA